MISWNEIKQRALEFSKEWENETREDAEAKSFWDGFFGVFGLIVFVGFSIILSTSTPPRRSVVYLSFRYS